MRASELDKMFRLEDSYWWFVARRRLVRDLLARYRPGPRGEQVAVHAEQRGPLLILDVGCGTGATLKVLRDWAGAYSPRPPRRALVVGLDSSREALGYSRRRGDYPLLLARGETLPVVANSVDVITALDLLEHIPDDAAAVAEFARALRPGGLLLVTVPALPWLWSEHDEALDHLRRYRAARLRRILKEAELEILRLSPLISLLLIPIAALRMLQRLLPREAGRPETAFIVPPRPINRLLIALLWLENRWALRWNLPVGVSLLAVARKG